MMKSQNFLHPDKRGRYKITPPPPVCTIPLPAAKTAGRGSQPSQPEPQFRKLAVTTLTQSQHSQKVAGYPRRPSRGLGAFFAWLMFVLLTAGVVAVIALGHLNF